MQPEDTAKAPKVEPPIGTPPSAGEGETSQFQRAWNKVPEFPTKPLYDTNKWRTILGSSQSPAGREAAREMAEVARLSSYAWSGAGAAVLMAIVLYWATAGRRQRSKDKMNTLAQELPPPAEEKKD